MDLTTVTLLQASGHSSELVDCHQWTLWLVPPTSKMLKCEGKKRGRYWDFTLGVRQDSEAQHKSRGLIWYSNDNGQLASVAVFQLFLNVTHFELDTTTP